MRLRLSQNLQKNQTRGKISSTRAQLAGNFPPHGQSRVHRRSVKRPFPLLMVPSIRLQEPIASAATPSTVVYPTQRNRSGAPAVAQGRAIAVPVSSRPPKKARRARLAFSCTAQTARFQAFTARGRYRNIPHKNGTLLRSRVGGGSRMLSTRAHVRPRSGAPIRKRSTVCLD